MAFKLLSLLIKRILKNLIMPYFDVDACMDAFCMLCEEAVLSELFTAEECQYWVFEYGYRAENASLQTFSKLCDEADSSDLLTALDCQFWLFERGFLAAKLAAHQPLNLNAAEKLAVVI